MNCELYFEIEGNCPSKKNRYRQSRGHWYKPKEVVEYIERAIRQIKGQKGQCEKAELPLSKPVNVFLIFEIKGRDKDIDGMTTTVLDILQQAGIIKNDNLVEELEVIKKRKQPLDLVRVLVKEIY